MQNANQPAKATASGRLESAVTDPARPEADRVRDADRKPRELIALTGMDVDDTVAEILPGGGYFTRIFSKLVGPQGVVYAWVPSAMAAPMRALAADPNYANVKVANLDPTTPLPVQVGFVWTSLNYHDLHNRPDADLSVQNKMVWDALKPGGLYMVIDHAAQKGSGARDSSTLHRIDPDLVMKEVTAAGFKFIVKSDLLKHTDDDHTRPSREVPRGKTDQFIFLFQKPA